MDYNFSLHLLLNLCPLKAFHDVDWASNIDDRCSTSGAAIFLSPNLLSWWSQKRKLLLVLVLRLSIEVWLKIPLN